MTNYGPPLNFKLVDTDTGEASMCMKLEIYELTHGWQHVMCEMQTDMQQDVDKLKLYQSTGHTDANGVEVFFGDVVVTNAPVPDTLKVVLHNNQVALKNFSTGLIYPIYSEQEIKSNKVIGNIHHSRKELQHRAKDAQKIE